MGIFLAFQSFKSHAEWGRGVIRTFSSRLMDLVDIIKVLDLGLCQVTTTDQEEEEEAVLDAAGGLMLHLLQFFLRWLLTPVFFFLFGTINCQSCALWLFWPSDLLPKRHIFCFVFSVSSDSVSIPFLVWRNFFLSASYSCSRFYLYL